MNKKIISTPDQAEQHRRLDLTLPNSNIKYNDQYGNFVHCVPGGSLFSGEYVNYGIWSRVFFLFVFFMSVRLWIEVGPQVKI